MINYTIFFSIKGGASYYIHVFIFGQFLTISYVKSSGEKTGYEIAGYDYV